MILFQRWRIVVSALGLIALTTFLTPLTETSEVNPYNDYLSSAIFVSEAGAQPDEVYSCNEECDPDEGAGYACEPVSEAVYCGIQGFKQWGIQSTFPYVYSYWVYECDSFMAAEDAPDCQPTNP